MPRLKIFTLCAMFVALSIFSELTDGGQNSRKIKWMNRRNILTIDNFNELKEAVGQVIEGDMKETRAQRDGSALFLQDNPEYYAKLEKHLPAEKYRDFIIKTSLIPITSKIAEHYILPAHRDYIMERHTDDGIEQKKHLLELVMRRGMGMQASMDIIEYAATIPPATDTFSTHAFNEFYDYPVPFGHLKGAIFFNIDLFDLLGVLGNPNAREELSEFDSQFDESGQFDMNTWKINVFSYAYEKARRKHGQAPELPEIPKTYIPITDFGGDFTAVYHDPHTIKVPIEVNVDQLTRLFAAMHRRGGAYDLYSEGIIKDMVYFEGGGGPHIRSGALLSKQTVIEDAQGRIIFVFSSTATPDYRPGISASDLHLLDSYYFALFIYAPDGKVSEIRSTLIHADAEMKKLLQHTVLAPYSVDHQNLQSLADWELERYHLPTLTYDLSAFRFFMSPDRWVMVNPLHPSFAFQQPIDENDRRRHLGKRFPRVALGAFLVDE